MNRIEELTLLSRIVLMADQRAFGKLVSHYQEPVRRFFLMQSGGDAMLSDDLSQLTFLKVWQHLDSFKQLSSFSTWLYQIAYHVWLDSVKQRKEPTLSLDEIQASDELPEEENEQAQDVCELLATMSEPARTCLTLFYLEEMSVKEIAKIVNLSEDNVRAVLSRGRKKLRALYEKQHTLKK